MKKAYCRLNESSDTVAADFSGRPQAARTRAALLPAASERTAATLFQSKRILLEADAKTPRENGSRKSRKIIGIEAPTNHNTGRNESFVEASDRENTLSDFQPIRSDCLMIKAPNAQESHATRSESAPLNARKKVLRDITKDRSKPATHGDGWQRQGP